MMRALVSACVVTVATLVSPVYAAAPTDKAAAQALFDEGKRLMAQGHYAGGLSETRGESATRSGTGHTDEPG